MQIKLREIFYDNDSSDLSLWLESELEPMNWMQKGITCSLQTWFKVGLPSHLDNCSSRDEKSHVNFYHQTIIRLSVGSSWKGESIPWLTDKPNNAFLHRPFVFNNLTVLQNSSKKSPNAQISLPTGPITVANREEQAICKTFTKIGQEYLKTKFSIRSEHCWLDTRFRNT